MTPQVPGYVLSFEWIARALVAIIALGLIWLGAARMPASAKSRYATAGVLSAAFIGWLAVAQYLGAANTYFASTDTAVPTLLFGLLIPNLGDTEIFGRAGGKEKIVIDASLAPVPDEHGKIVFITAEGRDITEKKAHEREIVRQREELAKLDALKTQIFSQRAKLGGDQTAYAGKVSAYERLTLTRDLAEKSLASTEASLELARQDADIQSSLRRLFSHLEDARGALRTSGYSS